MEHLIHITELFLGGGRHAAHAALETLDVTDLILNDQACTSCPGCSYGE